MSNMAVTATGDTFEWLWERSVIWYMLAVIRTTANIAVHMGYMYQFGVDTPSDTHIRCPGRIEMAKWPYLLLETLIVAVWEVLYGGCEQSKGPLAVYMVLKYHLGAMLLPFQVTEVRDE